MHKRKKKIGIHWDAMRLLRQKQNFDIFEEFFHLRLLIVLHNLWITAYSKYSVPLVPLKTVIQARPNLFGFRFRTFI